MLNELTLWVCIALEALLLVRAARTGLFKRLPAFYFYICCVVLRDLWGTPIYIHYPSLYNRFYWYTEFIVAVIGYGLLVEIYSLSLKRNPGAAKFFKLLLFVMFFAIAAQVAVSSLSAAQPSGMHAIADLDRNLRQLQAILLVCLLALFVYYKIPAGKNVRGVALGYALFVGTHVIILTFVSHPETGFAALMRTIEPLSYVLSLLIWSFALWAPSTEVLTPVSCGIEEDYERLAHETRMIILRARTHLARAGRP